MGKGILELFKKTVKGELGGLRKAAFKDSPSIYGTDIVRINSKSTPDVEKMKQSAAGGEGTGLTKFGQKIQTSREKFSKFLKLPQPLNPTEYYSQFIGNPVPDRMDKIVEIKANGEGSFLGKILKESRGNLSEFPRQVIGKGIQNAKKALRKKILGTPGIAKDGNEDFKRTKLDERQIIQYSQIEKSRYTDTIEGTQIGGASSIFDDGEVNPDSLKELWYDDYESATYRIDNRDSFANNGNSKGGFYNNNSKFRGAIKLSNSVSYNQYTSINSETQPLGIASKQIDELNDSQNKLLANSDWRTKSYYEGSSFALKKYDAKQRLKALYEKYNGELQFPLKQFSEKDYLFLGGGYKYENPINKEGNLLAFYNITNKYKTEEDNEKRKITYTYHSTTSNPIRKASELFDKRENFNLDDWVVDNIKNENDARYGWFGRSIRLTWNNIKNDNNLPGYTEEDYRLSVLENPPYPKTFRYIETNPNNPYSKGIKIGESENQNVKLLDAEVVILPAKNGEQVKTISVDDLRPSYLKKIKNKSDSNKLGYSKRVNGSNPLFINNPLYTPHEQSLEFRRGLGSKFDVINQTGIIPDLECENYKYNGYGLEDLDLIPLRFQSAHTYESVYLRSVVTGYSENIKPNWEGSQFLGDPFKVYSYTGVDRTLKFDVTLYALSDVELIAMWKKLDWLGHLAYPAQYSGQGVTPSIFWFTFGNLFIDKPAILTGLSIDLDDEKTIWEVGGEQAKIKDEGAYKWFVNKLNVDDLGNVSVGKIKNKLIHNTNVDEIKNAEYGYEVSPGNKVLDDEPFSYLTWDSGRKIAMSKFKLPRMLKASFDITLLESRNNTKKLWNYGETITSCMHPAPPSPPPQTQESKQEKKQEAKSIEPPKTTPTLTTKSDTTTAFGGVIKPKNKADLKAMQEERKNTKIIFDDGSGAGLRKNQLDAEIDKKLPFLKRKK